MSGTERDDAAIERAARALAARDGLEAVFQDRDQSYAQTYREAAAAALAAADEPEDRCNS